MKFKKFNNQYIVKVEKGEEIIETLKQFCKEKNIKSGTITGIGAINKAVIGYFETETKTYHSKELNGKYEVCSFLGNISTMNKEPYIHAHIVLSDVNYKVVGSHLSSAVVSATFEAIIDVIEGEVEREFSKEIGLNLYKI